MFLQGNSSEVNYNNLAVSIRVYINIRILYFIEFHVENE